MLHLKCRHKDFTDVKSADNDIVAKLIWQNCLFPELKVEDCLMLPFHTCGPRVHGTHEPSFVEARLRFIQQCVTAGLRKIRFVSDNDKRSISFLQSRIVVEMQPASDRVARGLQL